MEFYGEVRLIRFSGKVFEANHGCTGGHRRVTDLLLDLHANADILFFLFISFPFVLIFFLS